VTVVDPQRVGGPEPETETHPTGAVHPDDEAAVGIHPDTGRWWLGRLAPLLRPHRARLLASMLAAVAALVIQVVIPLVVGSAIDQALDARTAELWPFVAGLVALAVLRAGLTFAYRYGIFGAAYRLEHSLRTLVFEHLTTLSFSFYDRVQSGQIISRANSDIRSVQMFLAFAPIMSTQLVSFGLAVVIMLTIDVVLTIVALLTLPAVYVLAQRFRVDSFPLSWIISARQAEVATIVDENVNGVRVVKAFAAEQAQIEEVARAAERLRWANLRLVQTRARFFPLLENLPRVGLALVLLLGGLRAIDGGLAVGDLITFSLYIVILTTPFRFFGFLLVMGQRARASAGRIFEVLDERPDVVERPGAVDLVEPRGDVRFEHVSFGYAGEERTAILADLDLHIPAGQTVAVVGRTGSGKSTIPRLLGRFYDVDGGRVLVDGHDVRDLTLRSLRSVVAIVPDEPFLFSTTIHENIAYARPDATRDEVVAAARAAHADGFIRALDDGYDTVVGERGYDLSGGQRQRIAIARVLLADPAVLVLDDATSAVDVSVESRIHDALDELLPGRTTIVIAHRLSTIALADRVLLLAGGRIVADGTHGELLASEPRYAEVLASVVEDEGVGVVEDEGVAT
jgi:ATP-binding cassette subfamily B protein